MKTKICTRCGKRLNIDKFHVNHASKDGLHCHCKDCRREYVQTNGYKKYREYQTAYQNKYYHEHKSEKRYKQKRKQYAKDFLERHPGYFKEQARKYYKKRVLKDPNFLKKQYQRRLELHPDYNKIKSFKRKMNKEK